MHSERRKIALERARLRLEEAMPGSPDWDAASEAVLELEAHDVASLAEQLRRQVFFAEAHAAS